MQIEPDPRASFGQDVPRSQCSEPACRSSLKMAAETLTMRSSVRYRREINVEERSLGGFLLKANAASRS